MKPTTKQAENGAQLPNITLYRQYLNIASMRFNLSIDECRDKYGLFTNTQWLNLFNN